MNRTQPRIHLIDNITNVVLGDPSHFAVVEGSTLSILAGDPDSSSPVLKEIELPGPVKWTRDYDGKICDVDSSETRLVVEVMELTINPIIPLRSASRVCQMVGGGMDPIKEHMMKTATAFLFAEEDDADAETMKLLDAKWACRVYRVFNRVVPANSTEEPWGETIGCVAFHYVGLVGG